MSMTPEKHAMSNGQPNSELNSGIGAAVHAALRALPQAPHLNAKSVARWLEDVAAREPERLEWHVRRLRGFGGSEIGVFIGEANGVNNFFKSSEDIIREKLMMMSPSQPTPDTLRGVHMESLIAQEFLSSYGATRDHEGLEVLAKAEPDARHPWLIGNPDDLVLIGGGRYLVDYKCPNSNNIAKFRLLGAPLDYVCQLHHYRLIAARNGIQIDGLILAPFNTDKWRVEAQHVDYLPELDTEIIRVGDHFWNEYVLRGIVPEIEREETEILAMENLSEDVIRAVDSYVLFDKLSKSAAKIADSRCELVRALMDGREGDIPDDAVIRVHAADLKVKDETKYAVPTLLGILKERGIEASDCVHAYNGGKLFDKVSALRAELIAKGEDPGFDLDDLKDVSTYVTVNAVRAGKKAAPNRVISQLEELLAGKASEVAEALMESDYIAGQCDLEAAVDADREMMKLSGRAAGGPKGL